MKDVAISYQAGEVIFTEGDLGTEMFIIQEGEVQIVKRIGNTSHVLSQLEKGDFFGEMAVLENAPRSADAVATSDVKLIAINGSRFDEMLRRNPEIAVRIMRKYSKRLREANRLLESLAGRKVDLEAIAEAPSDAPPAPRMRRHRLVDLSTGTAFYFREDTDTSVGRADPVTGIHPDIDLTAVDTQRSVSRRHAKVLKEGDTFSIIEEVGTVNGTYVNEQRIPTGIPVPIQNGDRVKIGLIEMKVIFEA